MNPHADIRPIELPTPPPGAVRRRLAQAVGSASRHVVPAVVRGEPWAPPLRQVFDDLGATFTKFGQLFASSPSLFGENVSAAFRGCLDQGAPVPFPRVKAAVEDDLGRPLESVFASFDATPMAAASIAVVHRATLLDGRPVAVKVLRPGIEQRVATDVAVIRPLFRFLAREVAVGIFGILPGVVDGLEEQIAEELDLRNEARSMAWFRDGLAAMGLERVVVPEVVAESSGRRVLTMELLDGVPVDDLDAVASIDTDATGLVQDLVKSWFAMAFAHGAFPGDVHAGNLLFLRDGRVGVLDWGIVGRVDAATARFLRRCVEGCMGDESAWSDVADHVVATYGSTLTDMLGLEGEQLVTFIRAQVEPLFTTPFGQVDLTMLVGPTGTEAHPVGTGWQRWREERRRYRVLESSGALGSTFDRATFLLGKQLVYFERYGKLFMPDMPLLWDRAVFQQLLAGQAVPVA